MINHKQGFQSSSYPFISQAQIQRHSENGTDLGKALFFAIKHHDFEHALNLINSGAPFDCSYEVQQNVFRTTGSILVEVICRAQVTNGNRMICKSAPNQILDCLISRGLNLKCMCSNKFEHRCPLFVAIKILGIKSESEILSKKCRLVQKLIENGATMKTHLNPHKTSLCIPFFDIDGILQYLLSKKEIKQSNSNYSSQRKKQTQVMSSRGEKKKGKKDDDNSAKDSSCREEEDEEEEIDEEDASINQNQLTFPFVCK